MSATPITSPFPDASSPRQRFSLRGVSAAIDPRVDAVRADLADMRLADRVFAPHYAKALPRRVQADTVLLSAPERGAAPLGMLRKDDAFDLLDESRGFGWGVAVDGVVGYCDAAALAPVDGDVRA